MTSYGCSLLNSQAPQALQCTAYISRQDRNIARVGSLPIISTVKGGLRANSRRGPIPLRRHHSAPLRSRATQTDIKMVAISGVNFDRDISATHNLCLDNSRLFGSGSTASPIVTDWLLSDLRFGFSAVQR